MAVTQLVDIDEEQLLRHFCLEAECAHVIEWCKKNGHERPEDSCKRLAGATKLRELGNDQFQAGKHDDAMMLNLGALYHVDFSKAAQHHQSEGEKEEAKETTLKVVSNLSIIFLKRGDAYNSARAADLGLEYVKLLKGDWTAFQAKLYFRRGLAKGQKRDFEDALVDLKEAAKLQPADKEIRRVLENCKVALQKERGAPDDKWRGLLTENPAAAQRRAKSARCCRSLRQAVREGCEPKNLKSICFLLLAACAGLAVPGLLTIWRAEMGQGPLENGAAWNVTADL